MAHHADPGTTAVGFHAYVLTLPCRDALGRPRQLTITVHPDHLILRTPPGEVAVLDPAGTAALLAGVRAAPAVPDPREPR
jgi:hypothetical protein